MKPLIAHISSAHSLRDSRIFEKECISLAKAGFDVSFIGIGFESCIKKGVNLVSLRARGRIYRFTILQLIILYKVIRGKAKIVHFHDPDLIFVGAFLRLFKKIVIYDVHENYGQSIMHKSYLPTIFRKQISYMFCNLERLMVRAFGIKIVVADYQLLPLFDFADHLVVRNFPRLEEFADIFAKPIENDQKHFNALYIGSVTESRGCLRMLDVIQILRTEFSIHVYLQIVGTIESVLFKKINQHPAKSQIKLHGFLDYQTARALLPQCNFSFALLQPTKAYVDALPVKLLEYLSAGQPVVVSNFPRLVGMEQIKNGCLFVDPLDAQDIAKKISHAAGSGKLSEMTGAASMAVSETYSWRAEEKKTY